MSAKNNRYYTTNGIDKFISKATDLGALDWDCPVIVNLDGKTFKIFSCEIVDEKLVLNIMKDNEE